MKDLPIGITESGVIHTSDDEPFDLDTKFRMVKESGVYDYIDKTPPADQEAEYIRCSEKYDLPIRTGGWYYQLGENEDLLLDNLRLGARLGSRMHNTQITMYHKDGHLITNEEVAETYLRAYDVGEEVGCVSTFEVHVNMWSEDFRRVAEVAGLVEKRGIPYRMTMDHSHVIFKIDNPKEQEVLDIRPSVESGELKLSPYEDGNVIDDWINGGWVWHCHARAAVPNNPKNIWAKNPDGTVGRGIQYPFIQPKPGEYHSDWDEKNLEPWKEAIRHLMRYHLDNEKSPLGQISTEFIPGVDYGMGNKYSIFEHSMACAKWMRQTWQDLQNGT